jgi:hypothetical protein
MRYNLTPVVGLPADVVDGMARAPGWAAMVAVAPTLLYDHSATHEITVDPDWRRRWAAITMPTIVCSGDQTFPGMPEAADAVAAALRPRLRAYLAGLWQDIAQTGRCDAVTALARPLPSMAIAELLGVPGDAALLARWSAGLQAVFDMDMTAKRSRARW